MGKSLPPQPVSLLYQGRRSHLLFMVRNVPEDAAGRGRYGYLPGLLCTPPSKLPGHSSTGARQTQRPRRLDIPKAQGCRDHRGLLESPHCWAVRATTGVTQRRQGPGHLGPWRPRLWQLPALGPLPSYFQCSEFRPDLVSIMVCAKPLPSNSERSQNPA